MSALPPAEPPPSLDMVLQAYCLGYFPMARSAAEDKLYWFNPEERAVLPLDGRLHVPRSLARFLRTSRYRITFNHAFDALVHLCAEPTEQRPDTWINPEILTMYQALHRAGYAHSVECWDCGELVGGLYGLAIGGAFFGESMVSRRTNASKTALVALVEHLRAQRFTLLDCQFPNAHLAQFGIEIVPRGPFLDRLQEAVQLDRSF